MTRFRVLCLVSLVAIGIADSASAQSAATAENPGDVATERARAHFKLGVDLYREGNSRAALIEFKRAYKAAPHYKLLYNLAQASLELQEDWNAIDYFSNYLKQGGAEISADRRREVDETIERLKRRLATIAVTTNQPGAEIFLDETSVGVSPLREPVKVSVGRRKLTATKHGFDPIERMVDVAAGDHLELTLQFKDKPAPIIANLPYAVPAPREDSGLSAGGYMALGTGVLAAGSVTLTVFTAMAQKAYDDEKGKLTTAPKLRQLRNDAETKALVTDIAWAATGAAAIVTGVLLVIESDTGAPEQASVGLDIGPAKLGVHGRF